MKVRLNSSRRNEQGYMLITLILFVALLTIGLTVMMPELVQQLKRDREQELIHRGVQYSRAIQHFVKKNGRYPNTIEELESSSNIHYLRKRYKDPVTGKDFKILHMGDVQMSFNGGIQGAIPVANLAAGAAAAGAQGGGFGQSIFASSGFGNNNTLGGNSPGSGFGNSGSGFGGNSFGGGNTFGGNNGGTFGNSGNSFGGGTFGSSNGSLGAGNNNGTFSFGGAINPGQNTNQPGADSSQTNSGQPGQTVQNPPGMTSQENGNPNNKVFGGGPIVGVASISKDKTIRVFNKKDKYYEWQFIYDPTSDTGGLLSTPNQPSGMQAGAAGTPNTTGTMQNGQQGGFSFGGPPGSSFGGPGGQPVPVEQPSPYPPVPQQPQQPQQPQFPPEQGPQ